MALLGLALAASPALAQSDARLASISFSPTAESLSPAFSPSINQYSATFSIRKSTTTVRLVLADSNATARIDGTPAGDLRTVMLAVGSNRMSVEVTSADTTVTNTYIFDLVRTDVPEEMASGVVGVPHAIRLTANDLGSGTPVLIEGEMPPGMTITREGARVIFSGTPARKGRYLFAIGSAEIGNTNRIYYAITIQGAPNEPDEIVASTHRLVSGFLQSRQALLAGNIDLPGLLQRRAADPVEMQLTPAGDGVVLNFAASLASVDAARSMAAGPGAPPAFNAWIDGTAALQGTADGQPWGSFALLSLGGDYLLNDRVLLGFSAHLDRAADTPAADAAIRGNGWMAGPYASIELGDNIFWDSSLLVGRTANTIDLKGWTGDFSTSRATVATAISGQWSIDAATTLTPRLDVSYSTETVDDFIVTDELAAALDIAGFGASQLRASLGGELSHRIELDDGGAFTPRLGATAGIAGAGTSGMFGSLAAGASLQGATGWRLDGNLALGIDQDRLSVSAHAGLAGQF